jgi:hypothetical protein
MTRLLALWRGDLPLDAAFWTWAVFGGLAVNLGTTLLFVVLILHDRPILALLAGYAISVPYNVVAAVGVWRSAGRYPGPPHWATLARVVTVIGMALLSVT